jgi:hypothetical protein
MKKSIRLGSMFAALAFSAVVAGACNGSGLTAASTCSQFMNATPQAQQTIVDQLATQYNKPDYASPLGAPEVPYYCAANPNVTLGQFFSNAGD